MNRLSVVVDVVIVLAFVVVVVVVFEGEPVSAGNQDSPVYLMMGVDVGERRNDLI